MHVACMDLGGVRVMRACEAERIVGAKELPEEEIS